MLQAFPATVSFFGGGVLSFWDIRVCKLSGVILRRELPSDSTKSEKPVWPIWLGLGPFRGISLVLSKLGVGQPHILIYQILGSTYAMVHGGFYSENVRLLSVLFLTVDSSRDELWYASGVLVTSSIFGQPHSLQPALGFLLICTGDGICRACSCKLQGDS